MKVIMINAVYGRLSTGSMVEQLNEGLKKCSIDSSAVCSSGPEMPNVYRMGSSADVKLHSLMARAFGDPGYHSRGATLRLIRYLDSEKPDLIHLHNLHSNFIDLPVLFDYLIKKRIPVAVTLHDCWWYTGKCTHYTESGCRKWEQSCGACPRLHRDIPSWFFDRTSKLLEDKRKWFAGLPAFAVIGVSDWITSEAKKSFLGSAKVIRRIYNWIDTGLFSPTESDIRTKYGLEGKFVILGVAGTWHDSKGLPEFIELSKRLPPEMRVVLIGNIPKDRDIGGIVNIPLTADRSELAKWYSASDVFVTLSREESFGMVSAEALSCGTPVIAVRSTANPELVGEGCGFVIDSAKPEDALEAIIKVRSIGKAAMSGECRGFALKNFCMEDRIRDTAAVYRELLE